MDAERITERDRDAATRRTWQGMAFEALIEEAHGYLAEAWEIATTDRVGARAALGNAMERLAEASALLRAMDAEADCDGE